MRFFVLVIAMLSAAPVFAGKKAFILGNAGYEELSVLRNTHADAQAYEQAFGALGYDVSYHQDLDYGDTIDALDGFLNQIDPGDEVVFVYSGHGWSDGQTNYLIPVDAPKKGSDRVLARQSLALKNGYNGILDEIERMGAGLTVAVIDACRNNPFEPPEGRRSMAMTRGLAPVKAQTGTFVIFSAGEGQEALDRLPDDEADQKLSVFTRTFVPHLMSGIFLEQAISKAQVETAALARKAGGHMQHPAYYDQTLGDTCMSGSCNETPVIQPIEPVIQQEPTVTENLVPRPLSQCDALYAEAKDAGACFAYEAYAEICNDHVYVALAKAFMKRRCEAVVAVDPKPVEVDPKPLQLAGADQSPLVRACDAEATATDHPDIVSLKIRSKGRAFNEISAVTAISACRNAINSFPNHARSLSALARAYEADGDLDQARTYYEMAIDQGDMVALNNLGVMYANGTGVTKDEWLAVDYYRRSAEGGYANAANNVGWVYQNGRGVSASDTEAVYWYRKGAQGGSARAQVNLGWMYENGRGVAADDREAVRWYKTAAEAGNVTGQSNLGWMYQNGRGVAQDDFEAVRWYRAAADQGNARAQANLGWMYENGRGVARSDVEAVRYYRRAAELGNDVAQANLGWMYETGRGVEQDYNEAMDWYRMAADQGLARAETNLGYMYQNGLGVARSDREAVRWYRQAAEKGHAQGQFNLGVMYERGEGVSQNYPEAMSWYKKAAASGNSGAMYNLGLMYRNSMGVAQDDVEALRWYEKGAKAGHSGAQFNAGVFYDSGIGTSANEKKAFDYYTAAAKQGHSSAQHNLGILYRDGKGVAKSNAEAIRLFKQAVQQGEPYAHNSLGWMYENAVGVSKDPREAANLYYEALKLGRPWSTTRSQGGWDRDTAREMQRLLKADGHYSGVIDGIMGSGAVRAMKAALGG